MTGVQPVPCPVRLGTVKNGGLPAQLHQYALERNLHKVEKLLKRGVNVDCVNHLGQTSLFCASLMGFTSVTELLLQYGADPNHRCEDRSTPVHAAVFSCNPWLLSGLLDAGGDLRTHDHLGKTPKDWAEAGAQENSPRMLDFLKSCVSHMRSLTQMHAQKDLCSNPISSKSFLRSPSLLELLRPGGSELLISKRLSTKSSACDTVRCFGYGKLCIEKPHHPMGLLASLPVIAESELGQADDEPLQSFTCGSFIRITNYSWKGCRVSVKTLESCAALKRCEHAAHLDLLLIELEYCSFLFHAHLLQLLAVSMSADLLQTQLVFERVHVGSLHSLLHHKVEALLCMVLQVCEGLVYLHGRGLVLRALSSHNVLIVHPGVAKLTGLGYMVSSEGSGPGNRSHLPLPPALYNWAAPEVIHCRACTGKADIYSLCCLIQELYTDAVPWGPVDPRWIKQAVDTGQALAADPAVPQPYYQLLQTGLHPCAHRRTNSLQDLRYTLRSDIKVMSQNERCRKSVFCPVTGSLSMPGWSSEVQEKEEPGDMCVQPPEVEELGISSDSATERQIEDQLRQLDGILESETEEKPSGNVACRSLVDADSAADSEEHQRNISYRDILPLDEWRLSLLPPSSYPTSFQEVWSSSSTTVTTEDEGAGCKVSEDIGAIVLNLKVSQVLLEQAESSLRNVEMAQTPADPCFDEVDAPASEEEMDGAGRWTRRKSISSRVVGPPSCYQPPRELWKEEAPPAAEGPPVWQQGSPTGGNEASQYCSAGEDSFDIAHHSSSQANGRISRDSQSDCSDQAERPFKSAGKFKSHDDSTPYFTLPEHHIKPKWTREVTDLVSRMTWGRRWMRGGPPTNSGDEDTEDQLLRGRQDPLGHSTDTTRASQEPPRAPASSQENSKLEHLFKCFAGVPSESEDDSVFHTINQTFSPTRVWEASRHLKEEASSESDYAQSPVEPSSIFFTPKYELHDPKYKDRDSQTPSSVEDLDVTVEVCRPTVTAGDNQAAASSGLERHGTLEQPESEPCISIQAQSTSHLPDLAELAELSSITVSPTQHQEWVGQEDVSASPHNRHPPPCNSTPRSPDRGRFPHHQGGGGGPEPLLQIQSLLDTSPWTSAPSQSHNTEGYTTASHGDSSTTDASASSVLHSPEVTHTPSQEGTDTATTGNAKFTTASLGTQHLTESSGGPSEAPAPESVSGGETSSSEEDEELEDLDVANCVSEGTDSLSSAPSSPEADSSLAVACQEEVEDLVMNEEKECGESSDANPDCERFSVKDVLSNGYSSDLHSVIQSNAVPMDKSRERGWSNTGPDSLEETERAHSTLDEVLQGMLIERSTGPRALRSPGPILHHPRPPPPLSEPPAEGEAGNEAGRPGGDSVEAAALKAPEANDGVSYTPLAVTESMGEQGEKMEAASVTHSQSHRIIVLEQTPVKTQCDPDNAASELPDNQPSP